MDDDIEKACELASGIAYGLAVLNEGLPDYLEEVVKAGRDDAERLLGLLGEPKIGGALSLANPYPAEVAGCAWESFAAAVARIVSSSNVALASKIDWFTWMGCLKEYERATGKACNTENAEQEFQKRFKPKPCPECGEQCRVLSKQKRVRYIGCTSCAWRSKAVE